MSAAGFVGAVSIDWSWVARNGDRIYAQFLEHIQLTVLAVAIGFAIAAPLAVYAYRHRWFYAPVTSVTGVLYTIPSLALFAFLQPYTGLTVQTAEIGLVSYTLLILIRNTVAGLGGVPSDVREAARGMGYSERQLLWRVELPLALPVIVAGIRLATVTTIGLVTVTALIGKGGLGAFILAGMRTDFVTATLVGSTLSLLLGVAADAVLVLLERAVTPWSRVRRLDRGEFASLAPKVSS
ncbi:MAG: ABC transporter permease [Actinomycetota bacterium]|nr:ABC transporter permease [Actinomycetota bacterium]